MHVTLFFCFYRFTLLTQIGAFIESSRSDYSFSAKINPILHGSKKLDEISEKWLSDVTATKASFADESLTNEMTEREALLGICSLLDQCCAWYACHHRLITCSFPQT